MASIRELKVTVVGDSQVGKTSLVITFVTNTFPDIYCPAVFGGMEYPKLLVDNVRYKLSVCDTAGQAGHKEYEKIRPLSYPNTHCFLLCYAINNRDSLVNIENYWIPEVRRYCPTTPIIVIGTKNDLRSCIGASHSVSVAEGERVAAKVKAKTHLVCSAKEYVGLTEVFTAAVQAVNKERSRRMKFCDYL